MYFIKSIIDILLILLLLRLLIRTNEAFFDPIYRLIYRITDAVLIPSRYVTQNAARGVLLTLGVLVILRGAVYVALGSMTFSAGVGISCLGLLQLLFQAYMVIWFISLLSRRSYGTPFLSMIERAFLPFDRTMRRLGIKQRHFYLFAFVALLGLYALLSSLIHYSMLPKTPSSEYTLIHGVLVGLMLIIELFPFPGFFSVIIIIGALLSWVSPDPSNPVVQAIYGISEPLLSPFRRVIPHLGGLDISPILALFCYHIIGVFGTQLIGGMMKAF
jgi:YggT family protein